MGIFPRKEEQQKGKKIPRSAVVFLPEKTHFSGFWGYGENDDGADSAQGGRWGSAVGCCPLPSRGPERWVFSATRRGKRKIPAAENAEKGEESRGICCKPATFPVPSGKIPEFRSRRPQLAAVGRGRSVRGRLAGRSVCRWSGGNFNGFFLQESEGQNGISARQNTRLEKGFPVVPILTLPTSEMPVHFCFSFFQRRHLGSHEPSS